MEEYYRQHRDQFANKAQVKLRMIMIPGHAECGGGAAQSAMAEEMRAKLITGADFDKMAQMYSEDSTRDLGGDWGWVDDKTLAPPLSEVAFSLQPGEISKIVDLGGNYYILKVEARQGGEVKPLKGCAGRYRGAVAAGTIARVAGALARQLCARRLISRPSKLSGHRFAHDYCATMRKRIGITLGDPAGIGPEIIRGGAGLRENCPTRIIESSAKPKALVRPAHSRQRARRPGRPRGSRPAGDRP